MHNLKLLQLNYVHLSGSYERFPKRLRWLCWRGFPLPSIPNDLLLEKLVILEMPESNLKNVWNETKNLKCLKILDLCSSKSLTCTPNFSSVPLLEILLLEDCTSLVKIHESIELLERLDFLNLRNCNSLSHLPRSIGKLKFLKTLDISGCSNLEELPTEMRNMKSLKELHADGMGKLWNPYLESRKSSKFSCSLFPQFLAYLSLENCYLSDESFPSGLGKFMSLEELNLSGNPIYGLPDCFKGLPKLHSLSLVCCRNLHSITGLQKIKNLCIYGCEMNFGINNFCEYQLYDGFVDARGCENLNEIEGLFKIEELRKVHLKIINNLGLLDFKETNIALQLSKTHTFSTGEKFFYPQVCHSPVFYGVSLSKMEIGGYNCTTIKQFQESRVFITYICVFMTYICGSTIPSWFSFKNRGSEISFVVPPNLDLRIQGLTLCFVYVWFSKLSSSLPIEATIIFNNKTKKKMRRTQAWMIGLQETEGDEDIMMLNYWELKGDRLTAGDELSIFVSISDWYIIAKEIGVRLLYEDKEPEEKSIQSTSKEREETQQICTHEKVNDIDQHVSINSKMKPYLPIHLENGKLKLISNGCCNQHSYGGVIIDEKEMWMVGYYGSAREFHDLGCKLRGIFKGLTTVCQRGWTQVEVEVDSLDFLHLLHGDITFKEYFHRLPELRRKPYVGHKVRQELELIRYILKRYKCTLSHTPLNQWNQVALQLINMASNQEEPTFAVLERPPVELGLECLSKECAKIGEETREENPPQSTKVIVKSPPPCTHFDSNWFQKSSFCAYCDKSYCAGRRRCISISV